MLLPAEITEIARQTAVFLFEMQQADDEKWISQNKAWKRHGGRAFVTKLLENGKVAVRKAGNQLQYYQPDLAKHSLPKKLIIKKKAV